MRILLGLVVTIAICGCTTSPAPPTAAPPPSPPPPVKVAVPTPAPARAANWEDWPLTPGVWAWRQDARGSIALFGLAGADAQFVARCDKAVALVYLSRAGTASAASVRIRASSAMRDITAATTGGTPAYLAVKLLPRDPLLDAIAFTRGRFIVSTTDTPDLVLRAAPEFARVVEDCRGV